MLDIGAAVDYALNPNKKESSYIKFELIVSADNLPKF